MPQGSATCRLSERSYPQCPSCWRSRRNGQREVEVAARNIVAGRQGQWFAIQSHAATGDDGNAVAFERDAVIARRQWDGSRAGREHPARGIGGREEDLTVQ